MPDPTTTDLAILDDTVPDSQVMVWRLTEVTPVAGRPATPVHETARVARFDRTVILTMVVAPPLPGEIVVRDYADDVEAAVEFGNLADTLRRDGWTLRSAEPWEAPDPLAPDAPPPF